jgi:RNA polymerase subunit RPABC4/transcription elongation factor Spt4
VSADRCPACSAVVAADAPWCSLCYADLRTPALVPDAPVVVSDLPVVETVPEPAEAPADGPAVDSVSVEGVPAQGPAPGTEKGWPCHTCGAVVSYDASMCSTCGAGFLPDSSSVSVRLPLVGRVGPDTSKVGLILGGIAVITVVMVLLLSVASLLVK